MTFTFYSDPGHGWLRVDIQSAESVGLEPKDFSRFSYRNSHWLYLEEDCDAGLFIKAYTAKHGTPPHIQEKNTRIRSLIRNYPSIAA